ncbi:DsbA family protein [Mucilaginibacter daejeonensis]|uniref:DsbA family protein n=1 Tax=Mucilaginibacter daejeonensis TaxID=398049 RepID=UPI001D178DC6|nr:DsbA family protein [Mucilaginibacter daejeonensis]UEG53453.1 DsbA family protein [Mucilaginibacter daejeonensis]
MEKKTNPMLCDIETGLCEVPSQQNDRPTEVNNVGKKPLKMLYFTDPICSSCWGIEPQLRRLKLAYGYVLHVEYRMGGLLPDWSYNSGGISKPSDVAHHWDEVSLHYNMPIDGDVWLEDPLDSSYPPSIAFKAAQLQDEKKALMMLRIMREMVFLKKMNIAKRDIILQAAALADLDLTKFEADLDNEAQRAFQEDLALARSMGVRGFPTIFFTNATGDTEKAYGTKPYEVYKMAIKKLIPNIKEQDHAEDLKGLFGLFKTMTTCEFAELSGTTIEESDQLLQQAHNDGHIQVYHSKNGPLWSR